MKAFVLALALTLSVVSPSLAGTVSTNNTTISTARDLANTLGLNELQYLKLKGFETKRLAAIESAQAAFTGKALLEELTTIENTFTASLMEVLTPTQQKAYLALKSSGQTMMAQVKK